MAQESVFAAESMRTGVFTISLDFEIHWGVSDHHTVESYNENLRNVPAIVKRTLELFREKGIHATWATVGMLFCKNKAELFSFVEPAHRPSYINKQFSNYLIAEEVGENESVDPYHYASSLIDEILDTPGQELASHTFSHYYCLEPGQTPEQFFYDIAAAKAIARSRGVDVNSIVFPANQIPPHYLEICRQQGIKSYRGNYPSWIYQFQAKSLEGYGKRIARLLDTYIPVKGNRYVEAKMENGILNIPASCFLRPFNRKLSFLEGLRLRRMKREMKAAARKNKIYHLWWHPHNFGQNMDKNFWVLGQVLDYYKVLQKKYNMQSLTMAEIHQLVTVGNL